MEADKTISDLVDTAVDIGEIKTPSWLLREIVEANPEFERLFRSEKPVRYRIEIRREHLNLLRLSRLVDIIVNIKAQMPFTLLANDIPLVKGVKKITFYIPVFSPSLCNTNLKVEIEDLRSDNESDRSRAVGKADTIIVDAITLPNGLRKSLAQSFKT